MTTYVIIKNPEDDYEVDGSFFTDLNILKCKWDMFVRQVIEHYKNEDGTFKCGFKIVENNFNSENFCECVFKYSVMERPEEEEHWATNPLIYGGFIIHQANVYTSIEEWKEREKVLEKEFEESEREEREFRQRLASKEAEEDCGENLKEEIL